jgi:hypothetical protein
MRRNNSTSAKTTSSTAMTKIIMENQKEFTSLNATYKSIIASIALSIQTKQFAFTDTVASALEDVQRRLLIVQKSLSLHTDLEKNKNDLALVRQGLVKFVNQYTNDNNNLHQFIAALYPTPPTRAIETENLWRRELTALQKKLNTYEAHYQSLNDLDVKSETLSKMLLLTASQLSPATKGFEQERNAAINQARSNWNNKVTAHYMTLAKEKMAFVQKGLSHLEDKRFPNSRAATESQITKMSEYLNDVHRWLISPAVAHNKLPSQKLLQNYKSLDDRIENINKDLDLQRLEADALAPARKRYL